MEKLPDFRAATPDELIEALSFALRYDGRRRVHHADDMMARITADRLVAHLEASGFVVMRKGSMQTSGVCSGLGRFLAHEMR